MKQPTKVIRLATAKTKDEPGEIPAKNDLLGMAKYLERADKLQQAAKFYEKILKRNRFKELSYNRLMMIYRKQKDFRNELRIINAGIKAFQELYLPSATGKHRVIIDLSKKLNVLIGLTDKKGKSLAETEPIAKWKKRREIVLKKLKA